MSERAAPMIVGRYVLHAPIARGGMATIHLARLLGADGFSRMVAAKRLHPELTEEPEIVEMLLDEARIASKIHHPNVVPVLDVVRSGAEVILVQEYVHGMPFDKLLRAASQAKEPLPVEVVMAVGGDMLAGLAAAHEAKDELGASLGIIHRDVSPQNVLVGVDGIARLLDFGVAKATLNAHVTRAGVFKGKIAYTSPEQLRNQPVTPATDIYAAGVVIWEALAGRRLFAGLREGELVAAVGAGATTPLVEVVNREEVSDERWAAIERLSPVLLRALSFSPEDRWPSAAAMRDALLEAAPPAPLAEVSTWVKRLGREYLAGREKLIVTEESSWRERKSALPPGVEEGSMSSAGAVPGTLSPSIVPGPVERGRAQWVIAASLAVIGSLLAAILFLLTRGRADLPAIASATAGPSAPAVTASAPTAAEIKSATPPAASVTASAGAAPSITAPPPPRGAGRAAHPAPAPPPAPAPAAAPADCNPPFYFDGKKKVFKPGCI